MFKQFLSSILTLGLFVAFAAAPAGAQNIGKAKAHIPFDFIVAGETLPAGEYTVSRQSPGLLLITGEDASAFVLVNVDRGAKVDSGRVVFNRYGTQYFLSSVDIKVGSQRYALSESKEEKRLRRTTTDRESLAILTRSPR
jgi:hypothetical protein